MSVELWKHYQVFRRFCPLSSRGVLQKEGAGVNGIYNQDISKNAVLLELGGNENTITEVLNTIEIISTIIKEHINETGI